VLRAAGLRWKKCKKWLGKRDPEKRAAFRDRFRGLFDQVARGEIALIYIDEAHVHRDLEVGYSWAPVGERLWRVSDSPGLSERINWYGAYNFADGACLIWAEGVCNAGATVAFLGRVRDWVRAAGRRVVVVWDGAPWHRARAIDRAAAALGLEVVPLPGYSPDLNPVEGLWKWLREEVTQHVCHPTLRALFDACKAFVDRINRDPVGVVDRLWPRFDLDPEQEKLGFST
jgi:hypothetical protein